MVRLIILLVLSLSASNTWAIEQKVADVAGVGETTCRAYLNINETAEQPLPLLLVLTGTGVYSNGAIPNDTSPEGYLLVSGKANVLMIDKPGISFSRDVTGFKIHEDIYNRYTQQDLIACARNALSWALNQKSNVRAPIFLMGHSEGAQISVRLLLELLMTNDSAAASIKAVLLSGSPLDSWRDVMNFQMRRNPQRRALFWKAIKQKDTVKLRSIGNLGYSYWEDILNTEPLSETLKKLAQIETTPSVHFFHGLQDENTDVQSVFKLEAWNQKNIIEKRPFLRLSARYYNAAHSLNMSAMNDMIFAILARLE